jgi:hypothetical protein
MIIDRDPGDENDHPVASAVDRAAAIPEAFYGWLDSAPGWPEGQPEIVGSLAAMMAHQRQMHQERLKRAA